MTGRAPTHLIEPPADMSTLPLPPVPPGLDLRHFDCMHLNTDRLLNADIWEDCKWEDIAGALRLWAHSWRQVPCSSLPNDVTKVAKMLGLDGRKLRRKGGVSGFLRGFRLCRDGRLYHSVVAETALKAWSKSRAGQRGAAARWEGDKPLESNKTGHATAHGRRNSRTDDTLYSSGDGKADGRPDGKQHAEKGREYPSPLPPPLPAAGSGTPDGSPARPATAIAPRPAKSYDHGVEQADGRVCVHFPTADNLERRLWINPYGIFDCIDLVPELPELRLTPDDAKSHRQRALDERSGKVVPIRASPVSDPEAA